jgi:predicted transcriptional regulator
MHITARLSRRTQLLLDEERYAELERLATSAGRSVASVVREAIDDKLRREAGTAHRREAVRGLLSAARPAYGPEPDWAEVKAELRAAEPAA